MLDDRRQWTLPGQEWRMPTFYLVRDGRVIDQVVSRAGNRHEVAALLRRHGLLPPAADASGAQVATVPSP